MTWNLAQTMSLIKAAQHKYTHRKLVGRDPKTNRPRYRYYYARHHGGGITSAKFEEGSAFKLTFKGRRGHFHIQRVEGDTVFVKHDGRPGSKEVPMSQDELRALLEKQHSKLETKSREKAQKRRKSAAKKRKSTAKKRKSTKRTKSTKRKKTQTTAPKKTMRSYIAEQDEKISNLRAQIERLEQEEKNNPRVDHFDEIYKIKEEIGTLGRVRSIAQNADSLNNPKSSLNSLKDPRDRTKRIIPLEAYNEIIGILEDAIETQTQTPREELTETAQQGADNFETMLEPERSEIGETAKKEPQKKKVAKKRRSVRVKTLTEKASKEISEDIEAVGRLHAKINESGLIQSVDRGQTNQHDLAANAVKRALLHASEGLIPYYTTIGHVERAIENPVIQAVLDAYQPNKTEEQAQLELKRAIAQRVVDVLPKGIESLRDRPDYEKGIIRGKNQQIKERMKVLEAIIEDTEEELSKITPPAPQRSQTARAFSSMVDTIKSGERSQAAQDTFKTELNKVIDKAESGTLTDAERAELLPIAEQLVEVTSGRARALMTAVRDQIKGSSEGSEEYVKIASGYVRENRPPKISQQDIDKMTEEQLIEEQRRRRAYLDGASDMAYRKAPSIKELESKISTATKEYGRLNDAMNRGDVSEELFEEARDRLSEAFEEKEQHTRELSVLYKLDEVSNEVSALRVAEIASRKRVKRERAAARRAAKKRKG